MAQTGKQRQAAWRDRQRGGPARTLKPCGTRAAAVRHRHNNEPLDELCAEAERKYHRDQPAPTRNPT
jgi:hypothetical protein